jgi:hypothetical protein
MRERQGEGEGERVSNGCFSTKNYSTIIFSIFYFYFARIDLFNFPIIISQ